jgi:hypothetical protein
MTGQHLATLLHDKVCRELIEGGYQSVADATRADPDVPTLRPSATQVRNALNKLEPVSVIAVRKNGYWTVRDRPKLLAALQLTRALPGKLDTLENLAHRVGWSLIARLALGPATREQLNVCGNTARVTEHVKALRRSNAIIDRGELITLVQPAAHRKVQDALDDIARSLAMLDYAYADYCIQRPELRVQVGTHYCSGPDDHYPSRSIVTTESHLAGTPRL